MSNNQHLAQDEREAFEAWATAHGVACTKAPQALMFANGRRVPAGGYILAETALAWKSWQARATRSAQTAPQPEQSEPNRRTLQWVVDRWHAEVANRPLVNVHRRTLDSTWRQMIRHLGEDDVVLLGPRHDDMLDASGNPLPQYAAPIAQTAPRGETK